MSDTFRVKKTFLERSALSASIRQTYKNKVPVILCSYTVPLKVYKYICPNMVTLNEFKQELYQINPSLQKIDKNQTLVFSTENGTIPIPLVRMVSVYFEHKNDDGFLYLRCEYENSFG